MEGPILIHFGKLKASVDYRVAWLACGESKQALLVAKRPIM